MRARKLTKDHFTDSVCAFTGEGWAVFTAERKSLFYVLEDESMLLDLLSDIDGDPEPGAGIRVFEFDTGAERAAYLAVLHRRNKVRTRRGV